MNLIKRIILKFLSFFSKKNTNQDLIKLNFGQIKLGIMKNHYSKALSLNDYEFSSFSQFGEDGIIQYLINNINIENNFFIEFGTENYNEANTRFLLENNNWSGLIIESDSDHVKQIRKKNYYWKYDLGVVNKFITKENINQIFLDFMVPKKPGLLSIDIDGNDYWIWEEITEFHPSIVIIEYNPRFGYSESVSIPYDKNFSRDNSNYPAIYYGASLKALSKLGKKKNYSLVCTNLNGNNAFFVRSDLLNPQMNIIEKTSEECFHNNSFSEMRDKNKNILKLTKQEEKNILKGLPLENI